MPQYKSQAVTDFILQNILQYFNYFAQMAAYASQVASTTSDTITVKDCPFTLMSDARVCPQATCSTFYLKSDILLHRYTHFEYSAAKF